MREQTCFLLFVDPLIMTATRVIARIKPGAWTEYDDTMDETS
jgi:hypothetical protein